jgi:hypothetical protein
MIVDSREFSRSSKSKFQAGRSISFSPQRTQRTQRKKNFFFTVSSAFSVVKKIIGLFGMNASLGRNPAPSEAGQGKLYYKRKAMEEYPNGYA